MEILFTWENNTTIQEEKELQISKLELTVSSLVWNENIFFPKDKNSSKNAECFSTIK